MFIRRFGPLVAVLALFVPLACGKDGSDGSDDVASIDEAASEDGDTSDGGSGSGDGEGEAPSDEEFQDAALEHAQCMREQGIEEFPDPEFTGDGGSLVRVPEGVDPDELEAAEEECRHIMEEVAPDAAEIDPEQQAEQLDQLVEVAECMRERGHDVPDPEVDENGGVTFGMGAAPGEGGEGPDEDFHQDMEECNEEAGMEMPGRRGGGPASGGGA